MMNRRGFLGALGAVTTAGAAGVVSSAPATAYERITPYCRCGYQMMVLERVCCPTDEKFECMCERCRRVDWLHLWKPIAGGDA